MNTSTPVELSSDGNPWQVTFAPAGAVHADTDRGPLTGQWRLQGNFIAVELNDGRRHTNQEQNQYSSNKSRTRACGNEPGPTLGNEPNRKLGQPA